MSRRLALVLVMAVCLGVSYQAVAEMRGAPGGRAGAPTAKQKPLIVPEGYEKVLVTVQLRGGGQPSADAKGQTAGEKPGARGGQSQAKGQAGAPADQRGGGMGRRGAMGGAHAGGCPQTEMNHTLGVTLTQPHGCIVGSVDPKGPAGKAGIKPGDSIVEADGNTVTCPSTFVPALAHIDKSRTVKLTVLRKKTGAGQAAGKPGGASAHPAPKANEKPKGK